MTASLPDVAGKRSAFRLGVRADAQLGVEPKKPFRPPERVEIGGAIQRRTNPEYEEHARSRAWDPRQRGSATPG